MTKILSQKSKKLSNQNIPLHNRDEQEFDEEQIIREKSEIELSEDLSSTRGLFPPIDKHPLLPSKLRKTKDNNLSDIEMPQANYYSNVEGEDPGFFNFQEKA